jgi:hypothetical protein
MLLFFFMPSSTDTFETRFWAKVVVHPGGCWEWRGRRMPKGYGKLNRGTKTVYAHRLAFELRNGPIPDGLYVLHKCDNPPCINPDHLFLGTQADNVRDRDTKGRGNFRNNLPHAKLRPPPEDATFDE